MDVADLVLQVRGYVGDYAKVNYSDFQIIDALNSTVRLLAQMCSSRKDPLFRKMIKITVDDGQFILPDNFIALVRGYDSDGGELFVLSELAPVAEKEVLIHGNSGYSGEEEVTLVYDSIPDVIMDIDDSVEIPNIWSFPLSRAAGYFLSGNIDGASTVLNPFIGGIKPQSE